MKTYLYNDSIGSCELLDSMGSDLDIVNAARVSFNVEHVEISTKDEKLINYLYKNKHTSPFEHCVLKFRCVVPLFVARQHMRHRTWSYNEVSRRYTSEELEFYTPETFRPQHKSNRQASEDTDTNPIIRSTPGTNLTWTTKASDSVLKHTRKSVRLFNTLLESGVCREQARMVLPQNMYCKYIATTNLHNCLKFIHLRNKKDSQWEIRVLAQAMEATIKDLFPTTWKAHCAVMEGRTK
jgi:thymidylate synthase (FAD)